MKTTRDRDRLVQIRRMTTDGWFRTHIVPTREGPHRLFLNLWMRDTAGVDVGDTVTVTLKRDSEPTTLSTHPALRAALRKDPAARKAWDALPPSRKTEMLSHLNFLKSPEAINRTIRKILAALHR